MAAIPGFMPNFADMETVFLVVGKTTDRHLAALIDDYEARSRRYAPFKTEYIPELKNAGAISPAEQKTREGKLIAARLREGDCVVLLDEHGRELRSVELAAWLGRKMQASIRRLVFVVGGPYGFSPEVYSRADEKLSLSRLTFSHQMVRLLFVEQFYRAMTILRGTPYHHE